MKPGFQTMSMQEYQKDPCPTPSLSAGIAHILLSKSPLHAWYAHPKLNPEHRPSESNEFDLGSCAHAALLEGEASIGIVEAKDWRTKDAQNMRDVLRSQGKIPVLAHKMAEIRTMVKVAHEALAAMKINLSDGVAEEAMFWQERDLWCRARPDWRGNLCLDYKTTSGSAEPSSWARTQMVPMGYDLSAMHYLRGCAAIEPDVDEYIFLVQENYAPYACSFVALDPAMAEVAERKRDFATQLFAACLANNRWPGYPSQIAYVEPQPWQISEVERMIQLGAQG